MFPESASHEITSYLESSEKKSTVAFSNQMIQRVSPLNGFFFSSQAVSIGAKKV